MEGMAQFGQWHTWQWHIWRNGQWHTWQWHTLGAMALAFLFCCFHVLPLRVVANKSKSFLLIFLPNTHWNTQDLMSSTMHGYKRGIGWIWQFTGFPFPSKCAIPVSTVYPILAICRFWKF